MKSESSKVFQFRQFSVAHDRSSMRVGTDGVLIGAWAGEGMQPHRILDIGTGCGLIALMTAQRFPDAQVRAIDIDEASVKQAYENVSASPWTNRIKITHEDFNDTTGTYDLIVSNPPFFEEDTPSATEQATHAKHTFTLTFHQLIHQASRHLTPDGCLSVIIPHTAATRFVGIAATYGLYLTRRCDIRGSERRPYKRTMLEFKLTPEKSEHTTLTLRTADNENTEEYKNLTRDFYL